MCARQLPCERLWRVLVWHESLGMGRDRRQQFRPLQSGRIVACGRRRDLVDVSGELAVFAVQRRGVVLTSGGHK